jgi:hypothetical protein
MDTKATMAVTAPATSSVPVPVPVQIVAYTVLVQPPGPALSAEVKPADDPGGMPADNPGEIC